MPKIQILYLAYHRLTHAQTLRHTHTHMYRDWHTDTDTHRHMHVCIHTQTHTHWYACRKSKEIVSSNPLLSQNWPKLLLESHF